MFKYERMSVEVEDVCTQYKTFQQIEPNETLDIPIKNEICK